MRPFSLLAACLLACAVLRAESPAPAEKKAALTDYVRFESHEDGDSLETAVVTFTSPTKVVVDLVGAIHIADKSYFDALNLRFRSYDAVLYELVGKPMDLRGKPGAEKEDAGSLAWVGQLQAAMRDALDLHGQLEGIDYRAKNFIHADMSLPQFQKTREVKKESLLGLYFKLWQAQSEMQSETGDDPDAASLAMMLQLLMNKDNPVELKRAVAGQFDQVERLMARMEAGDGTVIVGERNRVAFEVLDKQIAAGKKHLAIFYGAAHLQDMEKRLLERGFQRGKTEWLRAWWLPYE